MNWEKFLVNQFLQDCTEAQEKGTEFHYTWLLILIALVRWKYISYYYHIRTSCHNPLAARYSNLWHRIIKRRHNDNNATFYTYLQLISTIVETTPHILEEVVVAYKDVA
jgi:hypothetical protein